MAEMSSLIPSPETAETKNGSPAMGCAPRMPAMFCLSRVFALSTSFGSAPKVSTLFTTTISGLCRSFSLKRPSSSRIALIAAEQVFNRLGVWILAFD